MYLTFRKIALTCSIAGLLILIAFLVYAYNTAVYTASFDYRVFKAGLVEKVEKLDPALITGQGEKLLAATMYEGLVCFDEKSGNVKPLLAKSWQYTKDGKILTIKLKKNLVFHNLQPVTAHKVKEAWERSFSNTKDESAVNLFLSIQGARERLDKGEGQIGIEAVDDLTLKINFAQPNSAFLYMLCNPVFWVYDADQQTEGPQPGTGPFILQDNQDNKKILLTANPNYQRGVPFLTAIEFIIYQDEGTAWQDYLKGDLDYLNRVPLTEINNVKADQQLEKRFVETPLLEIYALGFNIQKEPFDGKYMLRRAINYGIDRNQIVKDVFIDSYRANKSIIPPEVIGYNREMPGYIFDPAKAAQLLEGDGYPNGEGLPILTLSYNSDEGHQLVAEHIAQQLLPLGVNLQLQPMHWDYFKKQIEQQALSFFRIGWAADYPDADSLLYGLFHSSMAGNGNYTGYHNPQVDKILDDARAATKSNKERLALLGKAESIIIDDAPMVWLFQKKSAAIAGEQTRELKIDRMGMVDWHTIQLKKSESTAKEMLDSNQ